MKNKAVSPALIGILGLLTISGMLGSGPFTTILLCITAVLAVLLFMRSVRTEVGCALDSEKYPKEVNELLKRLDSSGVSEYVAAPPLYRMLWWAGFSVRPPLLASTVGNFATFFVSFSVFLTIFVMSYFAYKTGGAPRDFLTVGLASGLVGGALFAIAMTSWYQRERGRLRLDRDGFV